MTKKELLKRLESVGDDEDVWFTLFSYSTKRGYHWTLLSPTIDHGVEPRNLVGLATTPMKADSPKNLLKGFRFNPE